MEGSQVKRSVRMADFVIVIVVVAILAVAITYIIKEKKRGVKCIGCPAGAECGHSHGEASGCGGNCAGCSGCHTDVK